MNDDRRGYGWVWVGVTVVVVGLFVVAAYFIVDRAEQDRPSGRGGPAPTEPSGSGGDTTEAETTTTAPPTTQVPAELAVVVLNGTVQRGWAGENVATLTGAGYAAAAAADSASEVDVTTIYVAEGLEADGAAVATALGRPDAPVEPRPADSLAAGGSADADAQVVVVLGADSLG